MHFFLKREVGKNQSGKSNPVNDFFFLQDEMTDRPPSYPGSEDSTLPPPTVTIAASRTSEATCGSSGKELDRQQDEQEVVAKVSLLVEFMGSK